MIRNWYARPVFFVNDCVKSIEFYQSIGFKVKWNYAENQTIVAAQVNHNGIEIILNINSSKAGKGRLFVSLENGELTEFLSGIPEHFVREVYWGMPTKSIRDLDGNEILFYEETIQGNPG